MTHEIFQSLKNFGGVKNGLFVLHNVSLDIELLILGDFELNLQFTGD